MVQTIFFVFLCALSTVFASDYTPAVFVHYQMHTSVWVCIFLEAIDANVVSNIVE